MATTTNYGWTTPDDTSLVKDGAAAIRTLGSSVDTTTKALNPSTTLGDIEYRSATANTNTRLAIGSTGNVLTVAAGVPSWAAPSSGALVKITSQSFTTSAAVNVNDVFSTTYKNYKVMLNIVSSEAGESCGYRFRVSGSDDSSANYATQTFNASSTSLTGSKTTAQTSGRIIDMKNVNANQELTFFNPFATELSYLIATGNSEAASPVYQVKSSAFNATTSFTGFSLIPVSGTITGSLIVYGLAN